MVMVAGQQEPKPIRVMLRHYELEHAGRIGDRRQFSAMALGRRTKAGAKNDGYQDERAHHFMGACGELAVAKLLRLYWDGSIDTFKSARDVGNLEVRTRKRDGYDLIIRSDDPENVLFVLVIAKPHAMKFREDDRELAAPFDVWGYMNSTEARKRDDWIKNYGGRGEAWFVPKSELHPVHELMAMFDVGRN